MEIRFLLGHSDLVKLKTGDYLSMQIDRVDYNFLISEEKTVGGDKYFILSLDGQYDGIFTTK